MNKGTVSNRIKKRSILKHIARTEITNARLGIDYSVLEEAASRFAIIVADGFSELSPDMAYVRAVNNLAMSGAVPDKMMLNVTAAAGTDEQQLRDIMHRFTDISRERGVAIIGGNTVFAGGCAITVTVYGKTPVYRLEKLRQKVRPGDKIIIINHVGACGASLISEAKRDELRKRFSESYLLDYYEDFTIDTFNLETLAPKLIDGGAVYLHDVSFGGIYRTLVEMAEFTGLGVDILHEHIPIRQSTIELCEFFNLNPYQLLGTGAVAAAVPADNVDSIISLLSEEGAVFDIAGEFTADKSRIVHSENYHMSRNLNYYECDEIYKVLDEV